MTTPETTYTLIQPVFLIGFMGAGKTTVSHLIAETCGITSIDLDEYLERMEDSSVADIFREHSENYFRALETQYLQELATQHPRVISCGGGVVTRSENVDTMKNAGFVIYLEVTAKEAARRIPNTESRPLFKNLDSAREILESRRDLYEQAADATVNTTGLTAKEVADAATTILLNQGVLIRDV